MLNSNRKMGYERMLNSNRKIISTTKKGTRGVLGPKIDFRRSQNVPYYSVFRVNAESLFSQYQLYHLSKQPSCLNIIIDVFGS